MKIIIFGARGDLGSRIVTEALARGHEVTAVVRSDTQTGMLPTTAKACVADVADKGQVVGVMAEHDLAISVVRPPDGQEEKLVSLTRSILNAAAETQVRVLIGGGAASLKLADGSGHTVLTAPGFLPESVVPIATACQAQYEMCLAETEADWTYLTPPAMLVPGQRTGQYRLGRDVLLVDENGDSQISMEDFAVAFIDEAEAPRHRRTRFTVAS